MSHTRTPRTRSEEPSDPRAGEPSWRDRLNQHPMAPYHLILGATMLLLVLGLVMVLSSSSVESYDIYGSAFTLFIRQALFAAIGVAALFFISRMPISLIRRLSLAFLVVSFVLLVLTFVPGIGVGVNGQRNWIKLVGPFRLQPSEFAKLALILWSADLFARREPWLHQWRSLMLPFAPVAAAFVALVVLQGDLGTAIIMSIIVASLMFVIGAPMRIFAALGVVGLAGIAALSLTVGIPHASVHGLAESRGRPRRSGLAAHPGQVRTRDRWLVGSRTRWQQGEVGRPARGPHGLHLPGDR